MSYIVGGIKTILAYRKEAGAAISPSAIIEALPVPFKEVVNDYIADEELRHVVSRQSCTRLARFAILFLLANTTK